MKVLVTGGNGFIGRHVVAALLREGVAVRALVRPAADATALPRDANLETYRTDLRAPNRLAEALDGVDTVVHLAARMGGNEAQQFESTVVGTERLLQATAASGATRIVLASSYAVYDWSAARGSLTEATPVVGPNMYVRGPYTVAKAWQERVTRRMSEQAGLELSVLRPGFVWGKAHTRLSGMGQPLGRVFVVFGRSTLLPLTYVENCADAFAAAALKPAAGGETFNVVDDDDVTAWRYVTEHLRRTGSRARPVAMPYALGLAVSRLGALTGRVLFGERADLLPLFVPARFESQFKPLRFPNDKIRAILGWRPRVRFEEALDLAYSR